MTIPAAALACRLHAGRTDGHGMPRIDHLTAVVSILRERWPDAPEHALEAAWLHDAIGAAGATAASLLREGVSVAAVRIVERLTRPEGAVYRDWIARLAASGDAWAIRVKLADNEHNSMPGRAVRRAVEERYAPARIVLEAAETRLAEARGGS